MLGDITALLKDVFSTPFNYDESDEAFFQREKRLMANRLKSMKDNHAQRAFEMLLETMFETEDYKYLSFGDLDSLASLTLEDVKDAHSRMMTDDYVCDRCG
ncbi:hypothetical protein [Jeotgalicoccus sp. WY2]|uniref:hypothetical protein n=1 Tax=Jeotgalicoccus sp. WY2 TaxID=2708346 RepID=UPI002021C779|nr:hypothetical protein [Jeotgalicoccus sp. WY2]